MLVNESLDTVLQSKNLEGPEKEVWDAKDDLIKIASHKIKPETQVDKDGNFLYAIMRFTPFGSDRFYYVSFVSDIYATHFKDDEGVNKGWTFGQGGHKLFKTDKWGAEFLQRIAAEIYTDTDINRILDKHILQKTQLEEKIVKLKEIQSIIGI